MAYVSEKKVMLGSQYDYDDAVREIAQLLGIVPRDDGNYRLADICKASGIAMWAKCKPFVKVNKATRFSAATAAERKEANYGLTIPYATSPVTLKTSYYNQEGDNEVNNGWIKRLPAVTDSEPGRIRDFDGYWHDAKCPFRGVTFPAAIENVWQTSGFQVALPTASNADESDGIRMTDIDEIADAYFTIQLKHRNPSGTGIFVRTISADKTFREGDGGSVKVSTYQLPVGMWDVIPFISPVKFSEANDGTQVPSSYRYYPIPKCRVGELEISALEYGLVYFDGFKNVATTLNPVYGFSFNFAVKNYTSKAHTFNDVIVRVRFPNKNFDDILDTRETQVTINSFTVDAGETVDYASLQSVGSLALKWVSVNISEALYNNSTGIKVWIQLGSGQNPYGMYLRTSQNITPEYNPNQEYNPIVPEI